MGSHHQNEEELENHDDTDTTPLLISSIEQADQPPDHITPSAHSSDSRLEKILSDTELPLTNRLWQASCIEFKLLFRLAAPAIFVYLINNSMSLSTRIYAGHLGASAVMLCLETWYFQVLVLITGLLDNPQLALDSIAVCMAINGLVFMVSVGFNAAASVRVSNELGAGNAKSAAFAVKVVNLISFLIAVAEAILVLSLRHVISYAFTGGDTVAEAVSDLCPFLAVTLVLNGVQPVLSGVAVGCGWQAFVAYVNVGCYYVVGVPLGCLLGFKFDLGVKGIWSGMIGGTMMQTFILLWVTFRTDWNKEVDKAKSRLEKWGDKKQPLLNK
uniref:Uncharacterized protein n=1 Tax=Cannabis sativa TaxID=3483 RepID=A0A803NZN1_CANSA